MSIISNKQDRDILKIRLENSLLDFTRFFFKEVLGDKMMVTDHHRLLAHTLERVYNGEIKRLVINMPPGYTKTELAVIAFVAWTLAKNKRCRTIHATYSDKLALENSTRVRDIITSPEYQSMWPMKLRKDTNAKGAWKNLKGGGLQARAAGGPITGFRAGQPMSGYSGAFIIDDPIKPDDAESLLMVDTINGRFNKVFKSRLMKESDTPMILIMQRISDSDPSAYLLSGGTNEKWHHLNLPVLIDSKAPKKHFTHTIEIPHGLPDGPLWPYKHSLADIAKIEPADPWTFAAQYMQNPVPIGGGLFKDKWFEYYPWNAKPLCEYYFITADTASKKKEKNDYSCFACWGILKGKLYLIDLVRGKWEAPELVKMGKAFWMKHYNPTVTTGKLRYMAIEDKSSGTALIQYLKTETTPPIPVKAIQRNIDKVSRANDGVPYVASGKVVIPDGAPFTLDYIAEMIQFTAAMTHRFDDQVDITLDAIDLGLCPPKKTAYAW